MSNIDSSDSPGRIAYIDFLKFIGLTGIIIAHVGSPKWMMMARSFDVPLMVILSSILGVNSFKKYDGKKNGLFRYYSSRIKRLVIPTWTFLVFYFLLMSVAMKEFKSIEYYIASFCLTRYGVGYVWVILMYLYSAMLIPLYSRIGFSIKTTLCLLFVYVVYEIAYYYKIGTDNKIIDSTIYYIIPYGGVLTYLGYNYHRMKKKELLAGLSLIVFLGLGIYYWSKYGSPKPVSISKYPPRCYYLSYGIAVSFILLIICERNNFRFFQNPFIVYISKHSMWIYLWHILVLSVYSFLNLPKVWYLKLLLVYTCSVAIVAVVNKILDLLEKRTNIPFLRYLRG